MQNSAAAAAARFPLGGGGVPLLASLAYPSPLTLAAIPQPPPSSSSSSSSATERRDTNMNAANYAVAVAVATSSSGQTGSPRDTESPDDAQVAEWKNTMLNHPLFPLLGLLFEKCETATQVPDGPNGGDSFSVDLQSFLQHHNRERRALTSSDPEIDLVMVTAIQVLRIHLLELEKVQDLCKDFCNRYITCLRGKLQHETLLSDSDNDEPPGPPGQVLLGGGQMAQQAVLQQGQLVSGGTVYQMMQTPQGIVAQPVQVPQGNTPMSQLGNPQGAPPGSLPGYSRTASLDDLDDEGMEGGKRQKRGVLPKQATQLMKSWLFQHIIHPYPSEEEKRHIAQQTNLSLLQVNNWFINARRRILHPMMEQSQPEGSRTKKQKTATPRPLSRFWPDEIAKLQPQPQAVHRHLTAQAYNSSDEGGKEKDGDETGGSSVNGERREGTPPGSSGDESLSLDARNLKLETPAALD